LYGNYYLFYEVGAYINSYFAGYMYYLNDDFTGYIDLSLTNSDVLGAG